MNVKVQIGAIVFVCGPDSETLTAGKVSFSFFCMSAYVFVLIIGFFYKWTPNIALEETAFKCYAQSFSKCKNFILFQALYSIYFSTRLMSQTLQACWGPKKILRKAKVQAFLDMPTQLQIMLVLLRTEFSTLLKEALKGALPD